MGQSCLCLDSASSLNNWLFYPPNTSSSSSERQGEQALLRTAYYLRFPSQEEVQNFRGFKANIQWGCCFMISFRMWWDFSPASQTLNQAQIVLCGCSASVGMGPHGFGPCPDKRGLSTLQDASPEDFPSTAELLSKHSSLLWFLQDKKQAGKYLRLPENS